MDDNTKITIPTQENIYDNGKVNVAGINIDITQILGAEIVNNYMSQITPEMMQIIFDHLTEEIWAKDYGKEKYTKLKTTYGWDSKPNYPQVIEVAKRIFNEMIKDDIVKEISNYCKSDEYKQKAKAIAKEILDYAIDGYKKDIMEMLRRKLVIEPFDPNYLEEKFATIIEAYLQSRYPTEQY